MSSNSSNAVLLINLGTPDSPSVKDVRRYLRQFLSDGRVIDIPWLWRMLLVHGVIAPFRAPRSAKLYLHLWTDNGSPLLCHTMALKDELQKQTGDDVFVAMRYGNPSIESTLDTILAANYAGITVLPLFPQYASATTGSVLEVVMKYIATRNVVVPVRTVGQFFNHPAFIEAFAQQIKGCGIEGYDHVLFSYHGVPVRHVERTHQGKSCDEVGCSHHYGAANRFCYHAACYETTRLLASATGLQPSMCTTAFQSRLGKGWLTPFADEVVKNLAQSGVKRLLVVSPSFVADCLETTIEIGVEYQTLFKDNDGESLMLVPSLNSSPQWARAVVEIVKRG
jgi:ferrochelatase